MKQFLKQYLSIDFVRLNFNNSESQIQLNAY